MWNTHFNAEKNCAKLAKYFVYTDLFRRLKIMVGLESYKSCMLEPNCTGLEVGLWKIEG